MPASYDHMFEIVLSSYYITLKQAIDRLPLIPGILEIVGIGYTGVSEVYLIAGIDYTIYAHNNRQGI